LLKIGMKWVSLKKKGWIWEGKIDTGFH